ncbi:GNAT family N-acetyltransferase [Microbacterium jejuense]|uniref:GNAT family N-acetyltransferase n=1 Tax=Microbacterium jejuense TaxID=1263637 RepID=UPI0031EB87FC
MTSPATDALAPLTPDDAGEVLTLQRAAYTSEARLYRDPFLPALTQSLEELEAELHGPGLGLRSAGRLIGAVRWTVDDGVAHIGRLTVVPDLQGRGIGTRLLRAAEEASGADRFELFTGHLSEANIRLYEREGYVVDRREPLHEGVDLMYLVKVRPLP